MELQKTTFLILIILIFSSFFLQTSLSYYVISKNILNEIEKNISKNNSTKIFSESKIKCYFDKICIYDKPIKNFEKYFLKDDKIFKIFRIESLSLIDVYRLWNSSFENLNLTGKNISIAIIDTGIDINHKDLNKSTWKCFYSIKNNVVENNWKYCNDTNGHGTHIAGIVAGKFNGNISKCFEGYPCGVAPESTLLVAKVFEDETAYLIDVLNALDWAIKNNASIISMSFGIDLSIYNLSSCYPIGDSAIELMVREFSSLMDYITKKYNVVLISSVGNNPNSISTPACAKNVIAVGAINKNKNVAWFNSKGPIDGRIKPDIVAPGILVNSTFLLNTYQLLSGTSMATPFVSGSVALLLEAFKVNNIGLTSQEIKAILLTSPNENIRNNEFGSGILNVTELIRIRNNFLTFSPENNETIRFRINKNDRYPFKLTIYRHEFFEDNILVRLKIIKNNSIIYDFSSFDNVVQYKDENIDGIFEIEVSIKYLNISKNFSNSFTFVFSHRVINLNEILNEDLENSVHALLNVTIETPIELKQNLLNRNIKILVSDFSGIPMRADEINITILNLNKTVVSSTIFYNQSLINFEVPNNLNPSNYILYVIAKKGKRIGIASTNFTYFPIEFLSPKDISKVMNGDLLNITLKFSENIIINVSDVYLYLENNKNINYSIVLNKVKNIYYNISRINLKIPGKYILFLNISTYDNNLVIEIPFFEFSPIFNYNISYVEHMFADREYFISFFAFHLNGTKVNVEKTIICIENETEKIFCNITSDNLVRIQTNITVVGAYNITINTTDRYGNYLHLSLPVQIEYQPNLILINIYNNKTTILRALNVSAYLYNSTKNSICSFCKIFVNLTDSNGKTIFSNKEIEELKNWIIPKNLKSGVYNLTFYAKINSTIINSTQIEIQILNISTNVSEKIFPNFYDIIINILLTQNSNVSINITKINTTSSFVFDPNKIKILYGCENYKIEDIILWCNNTNNIILSIDSGEDSTFLIETISYNENINGYLFDRFYSGFLVRPVVDLQKTKCEIEFDDKSIIINPYLRNYCFFDSKNQQDMSINRFEEVKFLTVPYAGATLDRIIPINVTINVTYNETPTYTNKFNFSSLIFFNISNFTRLGKYKINISYMYVNEHMIITKNENYEINVYDINIYLLTHKNYTKVGDAIEVIVYLNRTNSTSYEIVENITSIHFLAAKEFFVGKFNYNKFSSMLNFSIIFLRDFNGNINIRIEDELGIEKIIELQNITAYDYKLELAFSNLPAENTAILGYPFSIRAIGKLLPFGVTIYSNFSITLSGSCSLLDRHLSRNNVLSTIFYVNTSTIGDCMILVTANASYLDLFFRKNESKIITIISLPQQKTTFPSTPSIKSYSLLIRKINDEVVIGENGWNITIIFVKSIGADQNVFVYILDYPQYLVQIIPKNRTILLNEEYPFIFNISLSTLEKRNEFEITILFNSSVAKNETKIKINALKLQILENQIEELEKEIYIIEERIKTLEEIIFKLQKNELIHKLLEAKFLLNSAKTELEKKNLVETKEKINKIKEILDVININVMEEREKNQKKYPVTIILIIVLVVMFIFSFLFFQKNRNKRPYYDFKKKKFVWSGEDESIWQKLKEKWKRKT